MAALLTVTLAKMNEEPIVPDYLMQELHEMELNPKEMLKKDFPRYRQCVECCADDVLNEEILGARNYFLQYFHKHLRHRKKIFDILTYAVEKKNNILRVANVLPDGLLNDRPVKEILANLNGKNNRRDLPKHAISVSEVLLKAGFVYPLVHTLMNDHPADFIQLMNRICKNAREFGHHVNMQDRMVARYMTDELLAPYREKSEEKKKIA